MATNDLPCKTKQWTTKLTMRLCSVNLLAATILACLPYISTLTLPSGDPAPGRSPGPPESELYVTLDTVENVTDVTTEMSEVEDACAFARSEREVVTLSETDSEVNLTVEHAVFETEQLVRGVVYEVHLRFDATIRDYALYSIVGPFVRGNFTPTSPLERSCPDDAPHFVPKHKHKRRFNSKFERGTSDGRFETSESDKWSSVYFRPRVVKSVRYRRRFVPARVVSGPLGGRGEVLLTWSVSEAERLGEDDSVVFRLRYRKITSATIYQVFFTKYLRLDCALHIKGARGRVHSGQLPRTHGCRLLPPPPTPGHALLLELHKLNVPCSTGFIRFAPNTPPLCGKLEQIPSPNRKFIYHDSKNSVDLHGRPTFAVAYRLVDHCHDVLLTERNGSFEVGPTVKLFCSYKIHLPYGNKVALRLQMGTGPIAAKHDSSNIIQEDYQEFCKGMELNLEDGDSRWKHCSQPNDPLRSVQIISEGNSVRLNISILAKRNSSAMWLKAWWMDKGVEEVVGHCDYGWVVSDDFCVTAVREAKRAWRQAEAECVRLGGHLASVLNERQQHILDQLLINAPGAGVDDVYWIGATDAIHEGEFRWSDGLPFSYSHWFPGWRKHSGQPNDDGTSGQDCVEARPSLPPRPPPPAPTFKWNDRGCREHNYFVCERPHNTGAPPPPRPPPPAPTFKWNDRGCREHNYFVCERPHNTDPYIATTIQCNETIFLSHLRPHATVSSPGFPRPYPDDVECVSELRAPPAHALVIHFEELLTEHEPQ
ncbi:uncharacterized protein LOC134668629 [Cydia fagiglandana]|uniref:uncharacterized protein LOC134668629 n=1 Tax=Cydia fagiglandana TaxID=1458189 RepID=UPI002FEDFBC7